MVRIARLDRDAPLGRVMRNGSGGCRASVAGMEPARGERRRRPTCGRAGVQSGSVACLPERRVTAGPYTPSFTSCDPSAGSSTSPGPRQTRTPGRERPPRTPAKRVRSEKEGVAHAPPPLTDTRRGGPERRRSWWTKRLAARDSAWRDEAGLATLTSCTSARCGRAGSRAGLAGLPTLRLKGEDRARPVADVRGRTEGRTLAPEGCSTPCSP